MIQVIQNFVEFRPLKAELLLRQSSSYRVHLNWSVRKFVCVVYYEKIVGIEQGSLEYKQISLI